MKYAVSLIIITGIWCAVFTQAISAKSQIDIPKTGSRHVVDGVSTVVIGAGRAPFSYVARGESLILVCLEDPNMKIVLVPDEGAQVKVDPGKPSCTVDGKEQLNEYFRKGTYVLFEYAPDQ